MKYKVEQFVLGGGNFYGLARLSAAGIPVLAVVHGRSTAGGAYMTGLADQVIMVQGRGRAFLAGPPLLKAATGEIADDESLGGAQVHASISGLAEYVAQDDAHALGIDFATLSPVLSTASHRQAPALGWDAFAALAANAGLPVYALGGMGNAQLADAIAHGAIGIAGISRVLPTP